MQPPQQQQQQQPMYGGEMGLPIMQAGGPIISFDEAGNLYIPNLAQMISFASNPPAFDAHPALKKAVLIAVDRSIREIVGPVVERSVSIATITTRELILKDFAQEPNEEHLRRAAHLMGRNLAANLSMITSKEPFRVSLTANLRSLFAQSGLAEVRKARFFSEIK
jgi:CCR4-NOT transcription complex subunit 1